MLTNSWVDKIWTPYAKNIVNMDLGNSNSGA